MNTTHITSISDVKDFLQGIKKISFSLVCKKDKYRFISSTLVKLRYKQIKKEDKTLIKRYLLKVTGYSRIQLKRKSITFGKLNKLAYGKSDIETREKIRKKSLKFLKRLKLIKIFYYCKLYLGYYSCIGIYFYFYCSLFVDIK